MSLSPAKALATVEELLHVRTAESARLTRLHEALKSHRESGEYQVSRQVPEDAPALMKDLARKSETNYLPLLVKTFAQVMKVDGYVSESDPDAEDPWLWWQRNRFDSAQTGLVRGALQYGTAYATALPGTWGRGNPGPEFRCYSPREMTAVYADDADEWPMLAAGLRGKHLVLFDEECRYTFGVEPHAPRVSMGMGLPALGGWLTYISTDAHGVGVCPVVRYRDRNLLAGEEQMGIVEPLLTISERINETTFQMMVAQYFQAFKQRYLIGWVPKSEQEELKAGAAIMWYLDKDPAEVKIGELEAAQVTPYIEARASAIRDFAAIGQIPAQSLGVDGISNISDATLAGLEAAKNRESGEIQTSLGESHEQLLRLGAWIDGNMAAAEDYTSEVRWRDYEARSFAQTVDGIVKLAQGLGLPAEIALEDVPGFTGQKLDRAVSAIKMQEGRRTLAALVGNAGPAAASGA